MVACNRLQGQGLFPLEGLQTEPSEMRWYEVVDSMRS
jgi:hypothetical protein